MRHLRPRILPLLTLAFAIGLSSAAAQTPTTRLYLPLLTQPCGPSTRLEVSAATPLGGVRGNTVAMAATMSSGAFISVHAVQPAPGGGADAYLAVWPK